MSRRIYIRLGLPLGLLALMLVLSLGGRTAAGPAPVQAASSAPVHSQTGPCAPAPGSGNCHPQHPQHPHGPPSGSVAPAPSVAPRVITPRATGGPWFAGSTVDLCNVTGCTTPTVTDCATPGNSDCTLRDAIILANTDQQDIINLKASATYTLTLPADGNTTYLDQTTGALKITSSMTLNGAAATIDGGCGTGCVDRVFEVVNKDTASPVNFNSLTIQHGAPVTNSDFAGCANLAGANGGGGILIDSFTNPGTPGPTAPTGPVALNNVTVTNNFSSAHYSANPALNTCMFGNGGGIQLTGSSNLTLTGVTLSNNKAGRNGGGLSAGDVSPDSLTTGQCKCRFTTASGAVTYSGGTASGNAAGAVGACGPTCVFSGGAGGGVWIYVPSATTSSFSNLTVSNNSAHGAGGMGFIQNGASVTLNSVTVTGNTAVGAGGGIGNDSDITATDLVLSNNTADTDGLPAYVGITSTNSGCSEPNCVNGGGGGGGLHIESGQVNITGITVTGNKAYSSGGIADDATGTGLTLTNAYISNNQATGSKTGYFGSAVGGGIGGSKALTITNGLITSNSASCTGCPATSFSCTSSCSGTRVGGVGGGIFLDTSSANPLTLTNVTVSGNTASCTGCATAGGGSGGGIGGANMPLIFSNVTVANNTANGCSGCTKHGAGGGIATGQTDSLSNVTISGNTANSPALGGGIGIEPYFTSGASTLTLKASLLSKNTGGDCAGQVAAISSSGFNIADDSTCTSLTGTGDLLSTDPKLALLANNGGPSEGATGNTSILQTMALQPGSPAIDHETSGCPPPATDERGVTRPVGAACDSGAVETTVSSGGGFIIQPLPLGTPSVTPTAAPTSTPGPTSGTSTPTPTATPGCATVTYAAGYNLAGGPTGTVLNGAAALFTFQASDTSYRSLSPSAQLSGGIGVWAFFFSPATVTLPCVSKQTLSVTLPANHFIMVANPGDTPATVSGADVVDTFNPATNSYTSVTGTATLAPGQGAWVFSAHGGTMTIASQ